MVPHKTFVISESKTFFTSNHFAEPTIAGLVVGWGGGSKFEYERRAMPF